MSSTILLVVDLDYTHFYTDKRDRLTGEHVVASEAWFGSPAFWTQMYKSFFETAAKHNVEVIFGIITSKGESDDLCQEAAKHFRNFLCNKKESMFRTEAYKECILYEYPAKNKFYYEALNGVFAQPAPEAETFSHFIILDEYDSNKAKPLLKLATIYDIPADWCIIMDDSADVLKNAAHHGINCVSMACFDENMVPAKDLSSEAYVNLHLERIKSELFQKLEQIIEKKLLTQKLQEIKEDFEALSTTVKKEIGMSAANAICFGFDATDITNILETPSNSVSNTNIGPSIPKI